MKKIVSILLSFILLFSILFPTGFVNAFYSNEVENTKYKESNDKYSYLSNNETVNSDFISNSVSNGEIPSDINFINQENSNNNLNLKSSSEEIPNKFDLREKVNIRVKSQGANGNCWAFASLESLETYLQLHGYGDYDFSEKHLAYVESSEFPASKSTLGLFKGGLFEDFEDYVKNSYGPVFEEEVPYNQNYTKGDYDYLFNIAPKATVTETVNFPNIDKTNYTYTDEELQNFRNSVKKHIMTNGSLFAYVIAPQHFPNYYNEYTYASYFPKFNDEFLRYAHAVSIIGWDDNYSKDNFNMANKPEHDGAYIALNSYRPYFGKGGIYYISYDDVLVEEFLSGVSSAKMNIEQKDDTIKYTKKYTKGDVDGDGDINVYDIVRLAELVFDENAQWTEREKLAGEIDGYNTDSYPDIYDVLKLVEYCFDGVEL